MARFPDTYFHHFWKQMCNVSWKTLLIARSCPAKDKQSSWALAFPRADLFQLNLGAVREAACPELLNNLLQRATGFITDVLQHDGEWRQPNHCFFFIWFPLPDKTMPILVSETGQGNAPGSWSCCLHHYSITVVPGTVLALNSSPSSKGLLGTVWEFAGARDISSRLFACGHLALEAEFSGMDTCCAMLVCLSARGTSAACLLE